MHDTIVADVATPAVRNDGIVGLYKALWHFAAGKRWMLIGALLLLTGAQAVMLAIPYFVGKGINTLQVNGSAGLPAASWWLAGIIGINLVSWILHGPGRVLERNVALSLRERMSRELIERLVQLPLAWHEQQHSGATAHRVQQSTNSLTGFAENQFIYLNSAVSLIGPTVALWLIDWRVGLAAVFGFVAISTSLLGFDKRMVRLAHRENDAERRYSSTLLDSLGNANTLFALRQARAVIALLQTRLREVFTPVKESIVINEVKWFTVDILSRVLACLLVALFVLLVTREHSSKESLVLLGSIYMVWEYAQQAGGVVTAVTAHFQSFARQQADYASADIIRDTELAAHLQMNSASTVTSWQLLRIRNLNFRHPQSRSANKSLDNVTLNLQRGKRYALIGASGSGKSTLLRILAGLYAADSVALEAESFATDSNVAAAQWLRGTSTLIPQDAEVFEGTLAENLAACESLLGPPTRDQFPHALELAQASEFVENEKGLDVSITERGANWSGGQRSRVALARGVLAAQGSGLVLLDEPTASLDPRTEALVYAAIFAEFAASCIVSSVHRLNLLERFDEVIVMRNGVLVAHGKPAILLEASADFRELMAAFSKTQSAGLSG